MVTRITILTQPWTPTWPPVLPSPALMDFVTFSRSGQVAWGSQILGHSPGSFLPFLPCLESLSLPASSGEPARGLTFLELATRRGRSTGLLSFSGILIHSLHTSPPQVGSILHVCFFWSGRYPVVSTGNLRCGSWVHEKPSDGAGWGDPLAPVIPSQGHSVS